MRTALTSHWPEYLIEAAGLALFMFSACLFGTLLGHPGSPVGAAIGRPLAMRALMGVAMGSTALALVLSPWGKRSGAHFNPALTFTFYRLGKIHGWDAGFYVLAQFAGGLLGVGLAGALLHGALAHPAVRYVVTIGMYGRAAAFVAEVAISCVLMTAVLVFSNMPALNRFTAIAVACLVALYITFEAPLSGMSMNPARTLASAVPARVFADLWIYFLAPPLGMLAAAELYVRRSTGRRVLCAKLHHENTARCIFRCEYPAGTGSPLAAA
jgi:aquaporin Z